MIERIWYADDDALEKIYDELEFSMRSLGK